MIIRVLIACFVSFITTSLEAISHENVEIEESSPQTLLSLSSFPTIRVLRWRVPAETRLARWTVWGNVSQDCKSPVNIKIWLKYSSFPVLSPDGGKFPPQMLPILEKQTVVQFSASNSPPHDNYKSFSISGPKPGNWYMMMATVLDEEQQDDKLCSTEVMGRAEYIMETKIITIIPIYHNYQDIRTFYTIKRQQTYRFFVPSGAWTAQVIVTKCSLRVSDSTSGPGVTSCPIQILASPLGIPPHERLRVEQQQEQFGESDPPSSVDCSSMLKSECLLAFDVQEESRHYITVTPTIDVPVEFAISVKLQGCNEEGASEGAMLVNSINTELLCGEPKRRPVKILFHPSSGQKNLDDCGDQIQLSRRNSNTVFGFDFVKTGNSSEREPVILKPNHSTVLSFYIDATDVGGTLAVELAIYNTKGGSSSEVREVVGCLSQGFRSVPQANTSTAYGDYAEYQCSRGRKISQTRSQINREVTFEQILIPYPSSGRWHLSLTSLCYLAGQGKRSTCTNGDVRILFGIHSNSCIRSTCGRYGRCYQYLSGGAMFSACRCIAGHTGPACNDPSQAESDYQLLTATLLLTTTNLAMLPAIMLALYRAHYAESVVYFSHLVSSCLYHACAQDVYSVCVLHVTVLRFCDVFSDILSTWVTLLAMASLPHTVRSVLHMIGAIGVALAVKHDITPITFLAPSLVGSTILLLSWFWRCISDKSCFPSTKYLTLYCLPGLVIGGAGLACLTFESSPSSSRYQHSLWHVARGVAVMLLLPDNPRVGGKQSEKSLQKLPVKKQTKPDVSFKQLTESNQSSIDDMAAAALQGGEEKEMSGQTQLEDCQTQL